ncbi:MAG: hypothetical protein JW861_00100 [Bacteroidales bacterium]|nr:hypothetical protein [Bacteroidales bacterium]
MDKLRKVINLENLPPDAWEAIREQYPDGWKDFIRKIVKPNGEFFHAITVDTPSVIYLVKVPVKIDTREDLEKFSSEKESEEESVDDQPEADHQEQGDEE